MNDLTQRLRELSSAEDFLDFFAVPFDPQVVNVSRLHILKRFFQYIRQEPKLPADNEQALYQCYRALLVRSYEDFVKSTPAREKVFKVFQDADGQQHVSLQSLRSTLPSVAREPSAREPA
ncbi:nitrogenase stabilizing/protective protein NifW [Piscinibacter sp.]|jgi:nitrogenase-stabilizing/protective protein|uniref:nitrogenase stabilizing/protective protein NifW n=1 Tax=Piscinibacter sp. TaxID=1903157 RepID=UPI00355A499D